MNLEAKRGQSETRTTCLGTGTTLAPGRSGASTIHFLDTQVDKKKKKKKNGQTLTCEQHAHVTEPVIGNNTHVGDNAEQAAHFQQ